MSANTGAKGPYSSPTEANAPAVAMDAKLMVATGSGDVQQFKDLVNTEDPKLMVVLMASSNQAASTPRPHRAGMDPRLLALASSGSFQKLQTLLNGENSQPSVNGMDGSLAIQRDSSADIETSESILKGITVEGDTTAHVAMGSSNQVASTARPHQAVINPLALAYTGSFQEPHSLLNGENGQASNNSTEGNLALQQAFDDSEANESIINRVNGEGDIGLVSTGSFEEPQSLLNREGGQASDDGTDGNLAVQQAFNDVEANELILGRVISGGDIALVCTDSSEEPQSVVNGEDGQTFTNVVTDGSLAMQASDDIEANEEDIALLCSGGSSEDTQALLNGEGGQAFDNGTDGNLPMQQLSDDIEANESILNGVTAEGDTALHVVAAYGQGDNFLPTYEKAKWRLDQNERRRTMALYRAERDAVATYGDNENFLKSALIIYVKAKHLLFQQNENGDTPLHCAARAGKSNMVSFLIDMAKDEDRLKELLRKENKHKETALHEAVRIGSNNIVELLIEEDSELASFPEDGASPLYLAIVLKWDSIVETLYTKSDREKLSYSGQNGQNALHAAVLRGPALTKKLLKWNKDHLCPQNKDLTIQKDENGSTPLHFAAALRFPFGPSGICRQVLQANAEALYQPDHAGLFPIHVSASVGSLMNLKMFVQKCPSSAGLRDAKGRTFLHVAVDKTQPNIIGNACRNLSLSWIMNMRDNDGNTALHRAVEKGSLQMFCPLLTNQQVLLNLRNKEGQTPLDVAEYKIPHGLFYNQNSEAQIRRTLGLCGGLNGVCRKDHFQDNKTMSIKNDEKEEMEKVKVSTQTLCIGSVLIATVTFGVTFAVPGGYIADNNTNGGTPTLARRYAFDAFITSNTLAFIFSTMATVALMYSGIPMVNPRSRKVYFGTACYFLSVSLTSLTAAFASAAYVVLAPVAHKTAVTTCFLTSLVLLYNSVDFIGRRLFLLPPLCTRKGLIWALVYSAGVIIGNLLIEYWSLLLIFGWASYATPAPKMEPSAQPPAPLP